MILIDMLLLHPALLYLQRHQRPQLQQWLHRLSFSQPTRGNVPNIQQPAKAPLAWKKQKLPADASVFKDKIWLRLYQNNSRMKRTKVSIVDLHAEQQARQRQGRTTATLLLSYSAKGHMHRGEQARDPARHCRGR
jgi:hypothetical protein